MEDDETGAYIQDVILRPHIKSDVEVVKTSRENTKTALIFLKCSLMCLFVVAFQNGWVGAWKKEERPTQINAIALEVRHMTRTAITVNEITSVMYELGS